MESIVNYLGLAIGLVLAIIGIVLQIKSTKKKEPVYSIKSYNLIYAAIEALKTNLRITYKKQKIEKLTVSKILFYNRGAETITREDIETARFLKIERRYFDDDIQLLDVSILQSNNYSSRVAVHLDETKTFASIDFDYLDKDQGTVIQVLHTGLRSSDINVTGDIRGVNKLLEIFSINLRKREPIISMNSFRRQVYQSVRYPDPYTLVFFTMFLLVLVIFRREILEVMRAITSAWELVGGLSAIFIILFIGMLLIFILATILQNTGWFGRTSIIPRGLEKFDE